MELKDVILGRTTVRRFVDRPVEREKVGEILEMARFTPSSGNIQNWVFVVVEEQEQKERIAVACLKQKWIAQAPVIIVVCDDSTKIKRLYEKRGDLYRVQNCAMVAHTILLAATNLGLGSAFVSAFDEETLHTILRLPEGVIPEVVIPIGYSGERIIEKPSRHTLDHLTRIEDWTSKRRHLFMPILERQHRMLEEKQKKIQHMLKTLKERLSTKKKQAP